MSRAIERWNLNTERNINYRSFEPILGLVRCYETPECQHWAVWALANLTKVRMRIRNCNKKKIQIFESKIIQFENNTGLSFEVLQVGRRGAWS